MSAGMLTTIGPRFRIALACGRIALGLALVALLLRRGTWLVSPGALPTALWLLIALNGLMVIGATTEARRLVILLTACGVRVSFWTMFRLVAIATLFSFWIPGGTGGDVMKLYYLAGDNKGRGVEIATVLLLDRMVALITLLLLVVALLAWQPAIVSAVPLVRWLRTAAVLGLIALSAGIFALWSNRLRASRLYRLVTSKVWLARELERIADAVYVFRAQKAALAGAAVLCLAGHAILAISMGLSAAVLLPSMSSPLLASTLGLLGMVANVLPVTPGGLGVGEAATETLVRATGVSGGAMLMASWRAGNAALCVLGGVFYMYGMRRAVSPREPLAGLPLESPAAGDAA
jgi:glycosyltransferase 2 family protein